MTEQFKFGPEDQAERLDELDPELTDRLARALDRFQAAQPYTQTRKSSNTTSDRPALALPELTPEQRAARDAMLNQQLSALLNMAAQLNQAFNHSRPSATPDRHYRDALKEELRRAAQAKKSPPENA